MADKRKTVEISINVQGNFAENLRGLADGFKAVVESVKTVQEISSKLATSFNNLSLPKGFGEVVTQLQKLDGIKIPDVNNLAKGFDKLSKIGTIPNLQGFADELKKFKGLTLPNLGQLATGFIKLSDASINLGVVGARLRVLERNLKRFSTIQVPNINTFAASFEKLQAINVNTKGLNEIVASLERFKDLKVPNLKQFSDGLDKLKTVGLTATTEKLRGLAQALSPFRKLTVPAVDSLARGFQKIEKLNIQGIIQRVKQLSAALQVLDKAGYLKSFQKFAADLNQISTSLVKSAKASQIAKRAIQETGAQAEKSGRQMKSFTERFQNYMQYRIIADAIFFVQDAIRGTFTVIKDYDQALKDLQAITGATDAETLRMGNTIRDVASKTKFSTVEVAEAMRTLGQAGFSANEAIQTMEAVANLATGTLSDMSTTVDLITTAMRVFDIQAHSSAKVADVFANAVNRSKLTIDKLRIAMNYVGPIAHEAGVTFEEMSASMMTLANAGLRASTIGTGLRRVFAELIEPSAKMTEAVGEVGLSLDELDPRSRSLEEVIGNLRFVVNDAQLAFDLFGKRGAAAALALIDTTGGFHDMLSVVSTTGTAAAMAAKQMEGLGVQTKNLMDKIGLLGVAIGNAGVADALRIIVNLARSLTDILIALVETALVKGIVKFTLFTAGLAAAYTAVRLLGIGLRLTGVGMAKVVTTTVAATASMTKMAGASRILLVVMNPLLAVLTGLAAAATYLFLTLDKSEKASNEASEMAAKFEDAGSKIDAYRESIVGLEQGSIQLMNANKGLRADMQKVALEIKEVANEANAAAQSINPLTGDILDGGAAINEYQRILNEFSLDKMVASVNAAWENIERQSTGMGRVINRWKDAGAQVWTLGKGWGNAMVAAFDFEFSKIPEIVRDTLAKTTKYGESVKKSMEFAKAIDEGMVSYKQLYEYVNSLNLADGVTKQQQAIIDSFNMLDEKAQVVMQRLYDTGQIDMHMTDDALRAMLEKLGHSAEVIDAIIEKVNMMEAASGGEHRTIAHKWAEEFARGEGALQNFESKYDEFINNLSDSDAERIRGIENERVALAMRAKVIEDTYKADIEGGMSVLEANRKRLKSESDLVKAIKEFNAKALQDKEYYVLQGAKIAEQELDAELERAKIKYGESEYYAKEEHRLKEEYAKKIEQLQLLQMDPKKYEQQMKVQTEKAKAAYEERLLNIRLYEAQGIYETEKANQLKLAATMEYYAQELKAAEDYAKDLEDAGVTGEILVRAEKAVEAARVDQYKASSEALEEYMKDVRKANDNIKKYSDKQVDEEQKNSDKREEISQKYAEKKTKIESDLTKKVTEINAKLHKKLADLNKERIDNEKQTAADIKEIQAQANSDVTDVRQRDMSPKEKRKADEREFVRLVKEGEEQVAKARRDNDIALLKSGQDNLKQAYEIAKGFEKQKDAINGIRRVEDELVKARETEGHLNNLENERQKQEEIEHAVKKRAAQEKAAIDARKAAGKVYENALVAEDKRHTKEMEDLQLELTEWNKKLQIAKELQAIAEGSKAGVTPEEIKAGATATAGAPAVQAESKTVSQAKADIQATAEAGTQTVETEIKKIEGQVQQVADAYKRAFGEAHAEVAGGFPSLGEAAKISAEQTTNEIAQIARDGYIAVEENGKTVYTNLTTAQRQMFKEMADSIVSDSKDVQSIYSTPNFDTSGIDTAKEKAVEMISAVSKETRVNIDATDASKAVGDVKKTVDETAAEKKNVEMSVVSKDGEKVTDVLGTIKASIADVSGDERIITLKTAAEDLQKLVADIKSISEKEIAIVFTMTGDDKVKEMAEVFANLKDKDFKVEAKVSGDDRMAAIVAMLPQFIDKTFKIHANVDAAITACRNLLTVIEDILKHDGEVVNITVKENVQKSTSTENKADGGIVQGFNKGGSVFRRLANRFIAAGSGFKDDVPALLMKGEFVHRTAAVRKYGRRFMEMINNLTLPKDFVPKFAGGGSVALDIMPKLNETGLVQAFAGGGLVGSIRKKLLELLGQDGAATTPINIGSMNVNNIIEEASTNVTTQLGKDALANLSKAAEQTVSEFATGGNIVQTLEQAKRHIGRKYAFAIGEAQSKGQAEIASVLQQERNALNEVAFNLYKQLTQLKQEYDEYVKNRTLEHKEEKDANKSEYDRQVSDEKKSYKEEVYDDELEREREIEDYKASKDELARKLQEEIEKIHFENPVANFSGRLVEIRQELMDAAKTLNSMGQLMWGRREHIGDFWSGNHGNRFQVIDVEGIYERKDTDTPDISTLQRALQKYERQLPEQYHDKLHQNYFDAINQMHTALTNLGEFTKAIPDFQYDSGEGFDGTTAEKIYAKFVKDTNIVDIASYLRDAHVADSVGSVKNEYDINIDDLNKNFQRESDDYRLASLRRDDEHKIKLADLKEAFDSDDFEIDKSFKVDLAEAKESYQENVKKAKEDAASQSGNISDRAKSEVTTIKDNLQDSLQNITNAYNSELQLAKSQTKDTPIVSLATRAFATIDEYMKRFYGRLRFNTGGFVPFSAGSIPGMDSIMAALTPGEFVIKEPVVRMLGRGFFEGINNFRLPTFNTGGIVGSKLSSSDIKSAGTIRRTKVDLTINNTPIGEIEGSDVTIDRFISELAFAQRRM